MKEKQLSDKAKEIVSAYIDALMKDGFVSMNDLIDRGYTKDMVTHHFRSLSKLTEHVRRNHPEVFFDEVIDDHISPSSMKKLSDAISSYSRFIITTAVTGRQVDEKMLNVLSKYCEERDAHILVLVSSDPATNSFAPGAKYGTIDKALLKNPHVSLVVSDVALNSNICLSTVKLSAKQIDPATSMNRIASKNGTFIFASPKQRLKAVPVSNEKFPNFVMTTGAITVSDYSSDNYMSQRSAFVAQHDHVMGALVVEIKSSEIYFFRQLQFLDGESIVDLGCRYFEDRVEQERPEAFILGDWHAGCTDPHAAAVWESISANIKPKRIVMHDMFDGLSINHHEREDVVTRANRVKRGQHDLRSEMNILVKDMDRLAGLTDQLVIVKSNHDDFLDRYLRKGYYVQDPQNHRYALDLAAALMDGNDPLRYAVDQIGLNNRDKVVWLSRDEDYKVCGIQLGAHGDLGPNGSRGSVKAMEAAYGQSITGHTHTPEILRGAWCVGTSSYLKLDYNRGPSSWLHSSCLLYKDGSRQLVNCIEGEYRLD